METTIEATSDEGETEAALAFPSTAFSVHSLHMWIIASNNYSLEIQRG